MTTLRPSPATIVATLALIAALGGTSYAAVKITGKDVRDNVLTGKDVRNRSITGADVKDASLTARDFGRDQLPRAANGPEGPPGPAGPQGPAGEQGAKGDTGPAGPVAALPAATVASNDEVPLTGQDAVVLTARLATDGLSLIHAWTAVELGGATEGDDRVSCQLRVDDKPASVDLSMTVPREEGGGRVSLASVGTLDVEAGDHTIALRCRETAGSVAFEEGTLNAIGASR